MGYKTITQIILIIIALILIFTYIKPTLITIGATQDELFQYSDALEKATDLNQQLSILVNKEKAFKRTDLDALYTYLPSTIDIMTTMSDISNIADKSGVRAISISAGEPKEPAEEVIVAGEKVKTDTTNSIDFTMTVNGSYEEMKAMLLSLAQNKYPLEVISLTFDSFEQDYSPESFRVTSSILRTNYEIVVRVYAYTYNIN